MRFPKWPRWVWRCYAATFAAVAAFVVCSLLPMWIVRRYYLCGWCGVRDGDRHSLWGMLTSESPHTYSTADCIVTIYRDWETPTIITAVAVQIATIAGALLGGIRWRKPTPLSEVVD